MSEPPNSSITAPDPASVPAQLDGDTAAPPECPKKKRRKRRWVAVIVFVFHVAGFLSSIHAVRNARIAEGAIAWAVSLNTLPYVAVPAYWAFGRSRFEGYITARRQADRRSIDVRRQLSQTMERYRADDEKRSQAALAAERLTGMTLLRGNRVDLLIDGEDTFDSIFRGIDAARDYVLIQFYIVRDDDLGQRLKERLLKKAAEGVRVYFLFDEVGSGDLPDRYVEELRDGGVEVTEFNTRKGGRRHRLQLNFRNHRKVAVTDGRVAWIGGHNVGDEYLGKDPRFGRWRDTHVRIEGPAALKAQISFVEDWFWATDAFLELTWDGTTAADGSDRPVLIIPSGPADELETASLMFVHAINSARQRIWIASPYFVPDAAVIAALQLAGLRGVEVRILIPAEPDHLLVYLAAYSYFAEAGRTGVEFYRYHDGFLHQKAMLIDDDAAAIGTANLDNRSFRLNFEITAFVTDPAFISEVEEMFERDFEQSQLMAEDAYERQSWWFRFGVRLARLAAPIL